VLFVGAGVEGSQALLAEALVLRFSLLVDDRVPLRKPPVGLVRPLAVVLADTVLRALLLPSLPEVRIEEVEGVRLNVLSGREGT
jgi:hypothetical protein